MNMIKFVEFHRHLPRPNQATTWLEFLFAIDRDLQVHGTALVWTSFEPVLEIHRLDPFTTFPRPANHENPHGFYLANLPESPGSVPIPAGRIIRIIRELPIRRMGTAAEERNANLEAPAIQDAPPNPIIAKDT